MAVGTAPPPPDVLAAPDRAARTRRERLFVLMLLCALGIGLAALITLLVDVVASGAPRVSLDFLTSFPSRFAERAGIKPALYGSLWLIAVTALFSVPVGIGAAIYLEEYARPGKVSRFIEVNISNLAGVPSIIYGLLGLAIFVRFFALGRSVLAGGLTLGLLVLPVIVTAGREAIRAVPGSIKEAALALGATEWQAISRQVVPAALPGFMTGIILSISRALGETAPLITMGALTFITFLPRSPLDRFTALPIQVYNWTNRPQAGFQKVAAAGIVVLLVVLLAMNTFAIIVRNRTQRKW
jgi:phosphate transport system permease protein